VCVCVCVRVSVRVCVCVCGEEALKGVLGKARGCRKTEDVQVEARVHATRYADCIVKMCSQGNKKGAT
jgi:hypothetical protein